MRDNIQEGPYTLSEVQVMQKLGKVDGRVLYWNEGMDDWKPLRGSTPPPAPAKPDRSAANSFRVFCVIGVLLALLGFFIFYTVPGTGVKSQVAPPQIAEEKHDLAATISGLEAAVDKEAKTREFELDNAAINKKVLRGMSQRQVVQAWGYPDEKKSNLDPSGNFRMEMWIYNDPIKVVSFMVMPTGEAQVVVAPE